MASRGFLIRFIDIGLIVLFGFVMISEIEYSSQVDLSAKAETQEEEDELAERTFVTVRIAADGLFSIVNSDVGDVLVADVSSPDVLAELLRQVRREYVTEDQEMIVLIRPHEDSIVQRTVDVMDVCDRLALVKSLQMDLEYRSAEGEA